MSSSSSQQKQDLVEPHVVVRIRPLARAGGHSAEGRRVYKRLAHWTKDEVVLDDNVDALGASRLDERSRDSRPRAGKIEAVGGAVAGSLDTLKKRLHPSTAKTAGPLQVTGAAPGGGPFVVGPGAGRVATSTTAGSAAATTPVVEAENAENDTALASPETMNGAADDEGPGGAPLPPLCRPQSYRFMREVLPPDATQEAVYASAAAGLVEKFTKENFNGLLFTYGQTGTGKTHTIFGPAHSWHDMRHVDAGVFPRAVVAIFESYEEQSRKMNTGGPATRKKFLLTASAMEFYMCQCTDLLDKNQACLIDEADHLPIGLSTVELAAPEDALAFMDSVRKNRVARETLMNKADKSGHAGSSRSHCALILTVREQVLEVEVEQAENTTGAGREDGENNNEILTTACYKKHLHIVDMAGAERPSSTGTENEIAIQAIMAYWRGAEITVGGQGFIVNYELSGLRTAVVQASEQHRKGKKLVIPKGLGTSFIEYTSGCFTGSNLLAMIVTLSPAPSCGWETWFSCSYGADLRKLRCPVKPVQPCCWARAPGRRKTLTGAGGGGEGTSTDGVLEKFVKELQKKASAAQAELEQTMARGGAGANKYLLKRTITARHCAGEAALWGRLLQK